MGSPTRRRSRAAIVEANDGALRSATISLASNVGWDSVTFTGVAQLAGLSVGHTCHSGSPRVQPASQPNEQLPRTASTWTGLVRFRKQPRPGGAKWTRVRGNVTHLELDSVIRAPLAPHCRLLTTNDGRPTVVRVAAPRTPRGHRTSA